MLSSQGKKLFPEATWEMIKSCEHKVTQQIINEIREKTDQQGNVKFDDVKDILENSSESESMTQSFEEYAEVVYPAIIECMKYEKKPVTEPATTRRLLSFMVSKNIISDEDKKEYLDKWQLEQ